MKCCALCGPIVLAAEVLIQTTVTVITIATNVYIFVTGKEHMTEGHLGWCTHTIFSAKQ